MSRVVRNVALGALGLLFLAMPATAQIAPELLQPHLVDVGNGRRINFHCIGEGSPTIVFEQGGEALLSNWRKVQPAITNLTRTCFYDRAGFGWSDRPDQGVTALAVTDDLHTLLQKAGITEKVILVGHSIGGFYATVFTDRFFDRVAGLVLVDPGYTGQEHDMGLSRERLIREQGYVRNAEGNMLRCAALARAHKLTAANLPGLGCYTSVPDEAAPEEHEYILHAITGPEWYEAELSQSLNYFTSNEKLSISHQQEADVARSFGDLPVVVLTSEGLGSNKWRSPEEKQRSWRNWHIGNRKLAERSTRGRWEIVKGSQHFIQNSHPDAVIKAITEVVNAVRYKPN
ncbi:alpha/beta hydrolase [Roseiterribacter gracilis]|uniref:AB hydrolase-1 domain-containing protein n=1 Tax=Roseiterribacter gracilis TaxID=2812848 RepID=A0A8S8X714_9PROT|nr:hypothetical protein TMPK1_10700 [Rhodospirillales bacterium TMPK1]